MVGKVHTIFERSWMYRRWGVFSQIAFCNVTMIGILFKGTDNQLFRDAFQTLGVYLMAIVPVYLLGGVWDDKVKGQEIIAAGPGTVETTSTTSKVTLPAQPVAATPPPGSDPATDKILAVDPDANPFTEGGGP